MKRRPEEMRPIFERSVTALAKAEGLVSGSLADRKSPPPAKPGSELGAIFGRTVNALAKAKDRVSGSLAVVETGRLESVSSGVAVVRGLPDVKLDELVQFENGSAGVAINLEPDRVGCILLEEGAGISAGSSVKRLGRVMDVPVGEGLLGRVMTPLGRPLDGHGPILHSGRLPIERQAPEIADREPVTVPLQTGIKVIDALIPIGRGQRQLILGDRQTGKTAIALTAMMNQRDSGVICIYCAIGQRGASVAKVIEELRSSGSMEHSIVIVAEPAEGPGLQYIAPYSATSIAEWFMERGRDALVVYDDLGCHARAWREISLLLRRPPGREAFPGDVFYLHSRLLERSTHMNRERGGGSLTALPIIETEAQNISAYIPTNLISITDGQLYLSPALFQKGTLPAVDIGRSVSRVGGKAQLPAYHAAAAEVKLRFSQFEELEMFARFGTRLDEPTRQTIEHGRRIRECLKQGPKIRFDVLQQILLLLALTRGLLANQPLELMQDVQHVLTAAASAIPADIRERILRRESLSPDDESALLGIARNALPAAGKTA